MATVNAVLFDYGLVLTGPPDPAATERMHQILAADAEAFHAAYWKFRDAYDRGALGGEAYWHAVAGELGRKLNAAEMAGLIDADTSLWTQPNQAMIDWASRLQAAGMKTGILSNLGDAMEAGVRRTHAWMGEFAHHTFSHRLGIAKPDLEIYRLAAEGLGETPAQVLFVDDREENIAAARKAGMRAVQYVEHDAFLREMREGGFGALLDV